MAITIKKVSSKKELKTFQYISLYLHTIPLWFIRKTI